MKDENIWKKFLATDLAGKVISIFKSVFLGIYFLKITEGNIVDVSMYYITLYAFYPMFFFLANKLTKINLVKLFRVGLFINLIKCVTLLISGNRIVEYILLFGILDAVGDAFYYYPQQILIKRLNKTNNFRQYFTINDILKSALGIIMPMLFGYCITSNSYSLVFGILIIFTLISFLMSFSIKEYNLKHGKINLKEFFHSLKEKNDIKMMRLMTLRTFARGLSSFGVLSTLITILTFLIAGNELSLGNINSFITILSMIVIYLLNKCVSKQKLSKWYIPISIIQSIVIIALTFSMIYFNINNNVNIFYFSINLGYILMLLYNVINGVFNPIFEVSNNVVYYECMAKQQIKEEDEPNYTFWFEIIINSSRALGYIILILVSKIGFNLNIIASLIVVFTLMYILFAYTLKKLNQKYLVGME